METRDFYAILGVGPEIASEAVRAAYRQRALGRPVGPVGAPGAASLEDLMDAYRVLSDPGRRASYDDALGVPIPAGRAGTAPVAEPLIPEQLSLTRDFVARDPSVDEV